MIPPTVTVTAKIRIFSDFTKNELHGYHNASPEFEATKRKAHRDCIAGSTLTARADYRTLIASPIFNPDIDIDDKALHPAQSDVVERINLAIAEYNKSASFELSSLEDDTDPTCVQWVEEPDGTVTVYYNYGVDYAAAPDSPPSWPLPQGEFRALLCYTIDSEA